MRFLIYSLASFALSGAFAAPMQASVNYDDATAQVRTTLGALVKADTSNPPGNEAAAVRFIAEQLKKAEIPYEIVPFAPGRDNIVARLKGSGAKKPLLLLAHLDVVGTKDQAWTVPPHQMTEKDGYLYGRGILDDLAMAAINLQTAIILKQSGTPLDRDVIVAWTGDEESGGAGIKHLLAKRPELIDAEIALNEGGAPFLKNGTVDSFRMQVAEKTYQDFQFVSKGQPGHSSRPKKENAITRLAQALDRLNKVKPEPRLIPATRDYYTELAKTETGKVGKALKAIVAAKGKIPQWAFDEVRYNPLYGPQLYTTCIPTIINGGTKENVIPSEVTANINCRILPDESIETVQQRLVRIVNDPSVEVRKGLVFGEGPASPVTGVVPSALSTVMKEMWPKAKVIPTMQTGGTDSRFLREKGVQSYGIMPIAMDEEDITRAHGIDERIPISSIRPGVEFFHKLVLKLAAASASKELQ